MGTLTSSRLLTRKKNGGRTGVPWVPKRSKLRKGQATDFVHNTGEVKRDLCHKILVVTMEMASPDLEEAILLSIIESLALEAALDVHWLIKTGQYDLDRLYDLKPLPWRDNTSQIVAAWTELQREDGIRLQASAKQVQSVSTADGADNTHLSNLAPLGEVVCDGHVLVSTGDGLFRGTATGELRKVHGNSKLHPKHASHRGKDGSADGAAGSKGAGSAQHVARRAAADSSRKELNQEEVSAQNFPFRNGLETCTAYSSSYYPATADFWGSKSSLDTRLIARCPVCSQPVAGSRFASHLERCLSGGRAKGVISYRQAALDKDTTTKPKKRFHTDPLPKSRIVRIRVNVTGPTMGLPKVFQDREGVSEEEWEQAIAARDGNAPL